MRIFFDAAVRAVIILVIASSIGIGLNLASSKPLPWIYEPPKELTVAGVKLPLIDEKEARKYFDDPDTIFLDTRTREDYADGHIEGAYFLPADEKEAQFQTLEPLLTDTSRLILYCHGPECEMAEQVALFLAQLGYKNMAVMVAGYPAWKKAGYPVAAPGN